MPLALSTSWNAFRHTDGLSLINEIKVLGFNEVELSFNLTPAMVDDVEKLVNLNQIKINSLHNYCPIPAGIDRPDALPDCYSMSSLDEDTRSRALSLTKVTIDTAARLNAAAVVLHCGRVEVPDRTAELITMFNNGLASSPSFTLLRDDILRQRASLKKQYLDQALRSIDELNEYACRRKVMLGVENRYYCREIPFFDEIEIILDKFRESAVYYWSRYGPCKVDAEPGFFE